MSLEDELSILQKVDLFHAFNREQLRALAFSSEKRNVEDHAMLYQDGAAADGGLVVLSGVVGKVMPSPSGPRIIERMQPGTLIDEHALIADTRRTGTAIAIGLTSVLVIRRELFRRVIIEYPELAASIHARWSNHLLTTTRELTTVAHALERIDTRNSRQVAAETIRGLAQDTDGNGD